jgi:hypothetical protein
MFERIRRCSHARLLVTAIALIALVAAQGLRLCLHADGTFAHDSGGSSVGAWHLEGDLMAPDAGDDESGDRHLDVGFGLFKHLLGIGAAILIAAFPVLFAPLLTRHVFKPAESRIPHCSDPRRRPPPRAPPL